MARATDDTRQRILTAAGVLFRRQGYAGTGLQQIARLSRAPVGSIYHFFDGKDALAEEVIRGDGRTFGAMVLQLLDGGPDDPVAALTAAFERAAADLAAADYADACPIATLALEVASVNERLRVATAQVFGEWIRRLADWCQSIVEDPGEAHDLATAIVSALEGAFMLSRSLRDPGPVLAAGRSLARLATAMRAATG